MRTFVLAVCVTVSALAPVGCGGPDVPKDATGAPTAKQGLVDLADLLKGVAEQKKSPPARQADLEQYDAINLAATLAITRKEVVYVWGSGIAAGSQAVIAYEKDAPTAGGFVLLQDGTVKSMTAAEFATAPKAVKK